MAFIAQTRLVRTASGTSSAPVFLDPPQNVARFNGIVRDLVNACQALPANQRPNASERGGYGLVYDIRAALNIRAIGVRDDGTGLLIVIYRVWDTPALRDGGVAEPVLINSHLFNKPKATTNMRSYIRGAIRDYLERAALAGITGDQRDPNLRPTTDDPTGFWDDPEIVLSRNTDVNVDTVITAGITRIVNPETGE
jgi:hypothetical protein